VKANRAQLEPFFWNATGKTDSPPAASILNYRLCHTAEDQGKLSSYVDFISPTRKRNAFRKCLAMN